ncbi:4-hydroxybenzoate octaprenyltransferase [Paraburkholderia phytofirmans]
MLNRFSLYFRLIRLDKPIGSLLLLWPTLIGLWIAAQGHPSPSLIAIFVAGTLLMRSVGCALNDYADRGFDRHVRRTIHRPLAAGRMAPWEAMAVAVFLAIIAFILVLALNPMTRMLGVCALFLAGSYPFMKRVFSIPQAYLGIAFGFGIPMAFSAVRGEVPSTAWVLLAANVFWSIAYDTEYAMVDRDDDIRIGIRSAAITLGRFDVVGIMSCYGVMFGIYGWVGIRIGLGAPFWMFWSSAVVCAAYHYQLIKGRVPKRCFAAFLHNNWVGGLLFAGVALSYS